MSVRLSTESPKQMLHAIFRRVAVAHADVPSASQNKITTRFKIECLKSLLALLLRKLKCIGRQVENGVL